MLNFKKVEPKDIEAYKRFLKTGEMSCENTFVNLLVWQKTYNNMFAVCDGQFILKSGGIEGENFALPFGDDFEKGMELIIEYCGKKPDFWAQEGPRFEKFKALYGKEYSFEENRDAFDYIYLREDLANLSGKKYHSKRNHISAFSKKYVWRYENLNDNNVADFISCAEKWFKTREADRLLKAEEEGIHQILSNYKELSVLGGIIYVEDKPVAFTFGSAINNEVFDIHTEKALPEFAECYTVINREFAKNALSDYKYINREDDLGLEGLRKAKLSYKPHILLKKYFCKPVNSNED